MLSFELVEKHGDVIDNKGSAILVSSMSSDQEYVKIKKWNILFST